MVSEVVQLAEFPQIQPKTRKAAFTFGLKDRWTHFLRTLPEYQDLLEPQENAISAILIPTIMERKCNQRDRHILTLLVWLRSACALQIQAGKQVGSSLLWS